MTAEALKRDRGSTLSADFLQTRQSQQPDHGDGWGLLAPRNVYEEQLLEKAIESRYIEATSTTMEFGKHFSLADPLIIATAGMDALVRDSFSKCFESKATDSWNFTWYLYIGWLLGVVVRYGILFPMRLLVIIVGFSWFSVVFPIGFLLKEPLRGNLQRLCIKYLCYCFILSWSGVIRFHGVLPRPRKGLVFVANHSSMIDMIILSSFIPFAVVGQQHPGWVGFLQNHVLNSLGCIFFERKLASDRVAVAQKLKSHVFGETSEKNPLLIFPEGTCVNNEYCVMFKKGAFELSSDICPIAIKYNRDYSDAFWNSRRVSFLFHLIELMTSWCTVCDIFFLDVVHQNPSESVIAFTERVKSSICKAAGLESVPWDGYLKYFKLSMKFTMSQQEKIAQWIKTRI